MARKNSNRKNTQAQAQAQGFTYDVPAIAQAVLEALQPTIVATIQEVITHTAPAQEVGAQEVAVISAQANAKRNVKVRKQQRSQKTTAAAPTDKKVRKHHDPTREVNSAGYIDGLIAGVDSNDKAIPTKLVDKDCNTHTRCHLDTCSKLRKGRSKYCPIHAAYSRKSFVNFRKTGKWLNWEDAPK